MAPDVPGGGCLCDVGMLLLPMFTLLLRLASLLLFLAQSVDLGTSSV